MDRTKMPPGMLGLALNNTTKNTSANSTPGRPSMDRHVRRFFRTVATSLVSIALFTVPMHRSMAANVTWNTSSSSGAVSYTHLTLPTIYSV